MNVIPPQKKRVCKKYLYEKLLQKKGNRRKKKINTYKSNKTPQLCYGS